MNAMIRPSVRTFGQLVLLLSRPPGLDVIASDSGVDPYVLLDPRKVHLVRALCVAAGDVPKEVRAELIESLSEIVHEGAVPEVIHAMAPGWPGSPGELFKAARRSCCCHWSVAFAGHWAGETPTPATSWCPA
jgi:hypothetical protein